MMMVTAAASGLHLLAAIIWVGGMFFAHMMLRPAANQVLEPSQRPMLMAEIFKRFFLWVWGSILILFMTGYALISTGGIEHIRVFVHIMMGLGSLMTVLFVYLFFFLYLPFKKNVEAQRLSAAAAYLGRIRVMIAINLALGLLTSLIAVTGRYY